jgi:DNA helicase-2/ATP-dependent DNA helicase PcrA
MQNVGLSLNSEQVAAAEFEGEHLLVLAGAGTGKTRTIIARTAHLIRKSVKPNRILVMTFTRRAARELTQRLERLVGPTSANVAAGTFHHFCLSAMRRSPAVFGIETATVLDRDDQTQLMKLARASISNPEKQFPNAAKLVDFYSFAQNTNCLVTEYLHKFTFLDTRTIERIGQVFDVYHDRKRKNGYLDYDDILSRFAHSLHDDKRLGEIFSNQYDHILVDEMQDTNPLQWLILDALKDPAKLFCVGDDAQSIYAFRGADFQNVHSFADRVPGSTILKLNENYRSTQEILDVANWLLEKSPLNYGKQLSAHRGSGLKPRLIDFESEADEAYWIAKDILKRQDCGAALRDHMILTRTAWAARAVEAALIETRIPYRFVGGMGLLQSAHVKDLLSLLRCASSPHDELAWIRYLTLWPRIGDVRAHGIITEMARFSRIEEALSWLGEHDPNRAISSGPLVVLQNWNCPTIAITEAAKFLEPLLETRYDHWESRKKDFELLVRIVERHPSLAEFLDAFTLDPMETAAVERIQVDDAVTLITVHSAKGTEAKVCYLIRTEPGTYPHARSVGKQDEEEEDRRVLYVAMTRAQDEMIITRSNCHRGTQVGWGGASGGHSRGGTVYFLEDLPRHLVEPDVVGFTPMPRFGESGDAAAISSNIPHPV